MISRPPRYILFLYPLLFLFFFNDTATTEIYTLSLHDALPICLCLNILNDSIDYGSLNVQEIVVIVLPPESLDRKSTRLNSSHLGISYAVFCLKKKKHTSELQSLRHLVCRFLLGKKHNYFETCD